MLTAANEPAGLIRALVQVIITCRLAAGRPGNGRAAGVVKPMTMGEEPGFDVIFGRRRRSLYALALQRLGVVEDAEDAVQETYVKCLGVAWQSVQSPDAMLTAIHLNVVRDMGRRRARSPVVADLPPEAADSAPCPAPDPEQCLLQRRRWHAVSAAIEALPPVCRKIFLMCKIDNLSHADISAATGMSRAAVEKNMVRALQRLRRDVTD